MCVNWRLLEREDSIKAWGENINTERITSNTFSWKKINKKSEVAAKANKYKLGTLELLSQPTGEETIQQLPNTLPLIASLKQKWMCLPPFLVL